MFFLRIFGCFCEVFLLVLYVGRDGKYFRCLSFASEEVFINYYYL